MPEINQTDHTRATLIKRTVFYVPPSPKITADLVQRASERLGQTHAGFTNPEVIGGLISFLTFIGQRLAFYANNGHQELINGNHCKTKQRSTK